MKFIRPGISGLAIFLVFSAGIAPRAVADKPSPVRVFEYSELDEKPVPDFIASPDYPDDMRKFGVSGQVLVDFVVDPDGTVRDAHPVSSTQYRFEDNAVASVSRWHFKPGKWHGHAVPCHLRVPIKFTLQDRDGKPL